MCMHLHVHVQLQCMCMCLEVSHNNITMVMYSFIVAVTSEERDGSDSYPISRREEEEVSGSGFTVTGVV